MLGAGCVSLTCCHSTVTGHFSKHGSQDHAVHWGTPHPGTWHGGWRWIKGSYSFLAWHWERQCPLHEKGNQGRCSWPRAVSVVTRGGASAAQGSNLCSAQAMLCGRRAAFAEMTCQISLTLNICPSSETFVRVDVIKQGTWGQFRLWDPYKKSVASNLEKLWGYLMVVMSLFHEDGFSLSAALWDACEPHCCKRSLHWYLRLCPWSDWTPGDEVLPKSYWVCGQWAPSLSKVRVVVLRKENWGVELWGGPRLAHRSIHLAPGCGFWAGEGGALLGGRSYDRREVRLP